MLAPESKTGSLGVDCVGVDEDALRDGMGQYVPGVPPPFWSCTSPDALSGLRA
ncbi:MAG TPA: hypothetical protein VLN49_15540 [Gemmatimonadaceae bacterium]|nr:hypothetical protein [Gemmatimonadaceae bacterium]